MYQEETDGGEGVKKARAGRGADMRSWREKGAEHADNGHTRLGGSSQTKGDQCGKGNGGKVSKEEKVMSAMERIIAGLVAGLDKGHDSFRNELMATEKTPLSKLPIREG